MPDPEYRKKHEKAPRRKTRQEQLAEQESALAELPDVDHGTHIIEWLHGIGVTESGDNGIKPLSWQEINAWKQATGTEATREELEMLHNLSRLYVGQYHRSENPEEPPPHRIRTGKQRATPEQISSVLQRATEGFRNK